MKKIGILSGMGASAGARFYTLLIEECQRRGAKDDCDFPEVVIYNVSSKGMDKTGICNERIIKADLVRALYQLDLCGVDLVIMACNSVHVYIDYLQKECKAKILNMVESAQVASMYSKVGIISSRTLRDAKLYRGLYVSDLHQTEVDGIIGRAISANYKNSQLAKDNMTLLKMVDDFISQGAGAVIMGCTEIPLILKRRTCVIDPAEIIIKEVLSL